jgi:RNase P subunit RPR2
MLEYKSLQRLVKSWRILKVEKMSLNDARMMKCKTCKTVTLHTEDTVTDRESATVWHCLVCGTERRPEEPGSPNKLVLA